jgi:hypothetical protein
MRVVLYQEMVDPTSPIREHQTGQASQVVKTRQKKKKKFNLDAAHVPHSWAKRYFVNPTAWFLSVNQSAMQPIVCDFLHR